MNINTISYWIAEALASIAKNIKIFLSGIAIMTIALFLIAFFYIMYGLSDNLIDSFEDSQGRIEAFLKDDIGEEQTQIVQNTILSISGVKSVEYISKDMAVERAKNRVPQGIIPKDLPDKIYPPSFIITVSDIDLVKGIAMEIRGIEGVGEKESDVQVNRNIELINKIINTVKVVAITIFIIATVSACFIMMNSIKLMLYSRRKEISIMKYVGATDTFTKAPFIIEGLIIGLASATIVLIISNMICSLLVDLGSRLPMLIFLTEASNIIKELTVILLVLSAIVATLGSSISINKYLDV